MPAVAAPAPSPAPHEPRHAQLCVACPYCGKLNALHHLADTSACWKCRRPFANIFERKPAPGEDDDLEPVKILGNELPAWAVRLALWLIGGVVVVIVLLAGLRLVHPPGFRSVVGAVSDVTAIFNLKGETIRFDRNLTFFVPVDGVADPEARWADLVKRLKDAGATGYTRWAVQGSSGDNVRRGHFVLLALKADGPSKLDEAGVKAAFEAVYGKDEAFFLITERLR